MKRDHCKMCGQKVRMMIYRRTRICSQKCEKAFHEQVERLGKLSDPPEITMDHLCEHGYAAKKCDIIGCPHRWYKLSDPSETVQS